MLIRDLLITPSSVEKWTLEQWDLLIQQGYATGLLARIYAALVEKKLELLIPKEALWHLTSAYRLYEAHMSDVKTEISHVTHTLALGNIKPIFLKGAAYVLADDSCHTGRLFADIDIFVDKKNIPIVEQLLHWHGWKGEDLDPHDEKYYREWMHEIPALTHSIRGMALDVHHNLVPLTSKISLNTKSLLERANNVTSQGELVLSAEDRILHSAMHLLLDGEFDKGFRDLGDIDALLKCYSAANEEFWDILIERADCLGIGRVLYYCLTQSSRIYFTPVPEKVLKKVSIYRPNKVIDLIINECFYNVLVPHHKSCRKKYHSLASTILFYRSHWLKMPLHILVPHLLYKAFITPIKEWKKQKDAIKDNVTG